MKIALIFGITGQDGSYLSRLIKQKLHSPWCNEEVHHLILNYRGYIDPHYSKLYLHYGLD